MSFEMDDRLKEEYDNTFDADDKVVHTALRVKSKLSIVMKTIDIEDLTTSKFKKLSRMDTAIGLNGIVGEWGVVTPIHVLAMEDEDSYSILDGCRRVYAAMRNGIDKINAIVWDFDDKEEGKEMANLISLMINRGERYSNKELWEQFKLLEVDTSVSMGLIEYLLQLQAGEAMKLKDVMCSGYDEIIEKFLNGELTIDGAYKKVAGERKKENRLAKEDETVIEGNDTSMDGVSDKPIISEDDVRELLELDVLDTSDDSFETLNKGGEEGYVVQDSKDRHHLDAAIRQQVLDRDDFKCQCCNRGGYANLPILTVHHKIQVSQGGNDGPDNLVTLCSSCHILVHTYAWKRIPVKQEDLTEDEQEVFKKIFKLGNIILEANKRCGKTKEQGMKEDTGTRHMYPGEGLKENLEAYKETHKE